MPRCSRYKACVKNDRVGRIWGRPYPDFLKVPAAYRRSLRHSQVGVGCQSHRLRATAAFGAVVHGNDRRRTDQRFSGANSRHLFALALHRMGSGLPPPGQARPPNRPSATGAEARLVCSPRRALSQMGSVITGGRGNLLLTINIRSLRQIIRLTGFLSQSQK